MTQKHALLALESIHPAFSQGVGENAWLTPFYSVYSKVPAGRAQTLVADKSGSFDAKKKKQEWMVLQMESDAQKKYAPPHCVL